MRKNTWLTTTSRYTAPIRITSDTTVVKESSYIFTLVLGVALALTGCNLETARSDDTSELRFPEMPLRAQSDSSFNIVDHSPVDGDDNQSLLRDVLVTFDTPLLTQTVTNDNVRLLLNNETVAATVVYVAETRTIRILPQQPLAPDSRYQVQLSSQLMSASGQTYGGAHWSFSTAGPVGRTSQSTLDSCMSADAIAMLETLNRRRREGVFCGGEPMAPVAPLSYQCTLANVAQGHAEDLAEQSLLSHLSSDGLALPGRADLDGYAWRALGENLALTDHADVEQVVESWFANESQCRNLTEPQFSRVGLGMTLGADGFFYWVQNLAEPAAGLPDDD